MQTQLEAAKAELQPKLDAVTAAREAAAAAETARVAAAEAARQVARELEPVSVLISRKTQRLYVRQGFEPVLDVPVTIVDPDRPIGTHIFTAMERTGGDDQAAMERGLSGRGRSGSRMQGRDARAGASRAGSQASARSALDRIVIPPGRIGSDRRDSAAIFPDRHRRGLSSETGKGTDFVVLLSGEPQGGIKIRRREPVADSQLWRPRRRRDPDAEFTYAPPRALRSPYGDPFSSW